MFDFIKKLFQNKKLPPNHLLLNEVESWLDVEVSRLSFRQYLPSYYAEVQFIKGQLTQQVTSLQEQPLAAKDKEQVSGRVQHIVIGHRDSYVREIKLFLGTLKIPEKGNFSSLRDFQDAITFNDDLNQKLGELALKTEKSYHAAQHLFFEPVENIFKLLGQLNTLVANFKYKIKEMPIEKIERCYRLLFETENSLNQEKHWQDEVLVKEELIKTLQQDLKSKENSYLKMVESSEHQHFQDLQQQEQKARQNYAAVEDEIFTFFAKLNKPLRKYEHIALDSKPIEHYLENSVDALFQGEEFKIVSVLQALKQNLLDGSLLFDEKQRNSFVELIEKAERGYVPGLLSRGKGHRQELQNLKSEIQKTTISSELQTAEREILELKNTLAKVEKEREELQSKIKNAESLQLKQELQQLINNVFKKEMIIQS